MNIRILVSMLSLLLSIGSNAATKLPEALFSTDGRYSLIHTYDSLNMVSVDAWSLYLNHSNEELSIIIPENDSVFFVSYTIDRNYFPYYVTESGDTLACKIVNMMSKNEFLEQYNLKIEPLELARKIKYQVDTFHFKKVEPPYTDSIDHYRFVYTFLIDTHLLLRDTVVTNLDSTVYVVARHPNPFEISRLFYDPGSNYYWISSAIYSENLGFKETLVMTDTVIVAEHRTGIAHRTRFGRVPLGQ